MNIECTSWSANKPFQNEDFEVSIKDEAGALCTSTTKVRP